MRSRRLIVIRSSRPTPTPIRAGTMFWLACFTASTIRGTRSLATAVERIVIVRGIEQNARRVDAEFLLHAAADAGHQRLGAPRPGPGR